MTLTTTAVPIEVAAELSQKALDHITVLLEDGHTHNLESILEFLAEFNSDDFLAYYEDYEKLFPATQEFIRDNSGSYAIDDMLEFIKEHGEADDLVQQITHDIAGLYKHIPPHAPNECHQPNGDVEALEVTLGLGFRPNRLDQQIACNDGHGHDTQPYAKGDG
jgi:hypothetical protein